MKVHFIYTGLFFRSDDVHARNCNARSPEVNKLRSSQQEKFQNGSNFDPTKSVLDPLKTIKKERSSILSVKDF